MSIFCFFVSAVTMPGWSRPEEVGVMIQVQKGKHRGDLKKLVFVLFFLQGEDTKDLSLGNDRPYSLGQQALLEH